MSRSELHALARKYRALAELRRGVLAPEPPILRALAREFPGALRELECLPLDAVDSRLGAVLGAIQGEPVEPWIEWMVAYHQRMRLVLAVKRRLAERSAARDFGGVVEHVFLEVGERCDAALLLAVAQPPAGRLNRLVFELLERELERPGAELEAALFPALDRRRSSRAMGGLR